MTGVQTCALPIYVMGMETIMLKMHDAPEIAHRLLEKITDCRYAFIERILETAPWVDEIIIMDELGAQNGLLFSPRVFKTFLYPYHKRLTDLIHSYGKRAYYHSCGSVRKLIPNLVDMGIDILDNIQPTAANMDPHEIKAEFDSLTLSVQTDEIHRLVHSTPDEIYSFYRELCVEMSKGGRFIISPTFRAQTTPKANLEALLKAIAEPF